MIAQAGSRLFVPFLDDIDGVVCLSADATINEIREQATPHRLRYPLAIDGNVPIRDQINSTGFAPASSRFGPLCDNIIGMNWKLPNGRVVRIGERVVKTTTGYDLFRFLLSSGERFGRPIDYVLRLRPDCGTTSTFLLSGKVESIAQAVQSLLKNCWMHWFDSIDVLSDETTADYQLRIVLNCPANEFPVAETYVSSLAASHELTVNATLDTSTPLDGCPDFVLKTTSEHVLTLAKAIRDRHQVRCVALCYNGVIHGYFPDENNLAQRIQKIVSQFAGDLYAIGGDWHSRHLPAVTPSAIEANWISTLVKESNIS